MNVHASSASDGLLILPHLNVQNANAISGPFTHGLPAMSAFLGFMWALERRLVANGMALQFDGIGVICHDYQEHVQDGYIKTFRLTRNPVDKAGETAAIAEEGRVNLDITLVLGVSGAAGESRLLGADDKGLRALAADIGNTVATMRVAGGTVLPPRRGPGRHIRPELVELDQRPELAAAQFRYIRRHWLPGFALVSRDDLVAQHTRALQERNPQATQFDAWLELSGFRWAPVAASPTGDAFDPDRKVEWRHGRKGWLVPIPVGYGALSAVHPPGAVLNSRDGSTPSRFVESLYGMGEWVSPHRLSCPSDLLWYAHNDLQKGLYRCRNDYRPSAVVFPNQSN